MGLSASFPQLLKLFVFSFNCLHFLRTSEIRGGFSYTDQITYSRKLGSAGNVGKEWELCGFDPDLYLLNRIKCFLGFYFPHIFNAFQSPMFAKETIKEPSNHSVQHINRHWHPTIDD